MNVGLVQRAGITAALSIVLSLLAASAQGPNLSPPSWQPNIPYGAAKPVDYGPPLLQDPAKPREYSPSGNLATDMRLPVPVMQATFESRDADPPSQPPVGHDGSSPLGPDQAILNPIPADQPPPAIQSAEPLPMADRALQADASETFAEPRDNAGEGQAAWPTRYV